MRGGSFSPPLPKQRVRTHPSLYKWVRRVSRNRYQARAWLPVEHGGSINLGLYLTEVAADQAVRHWIAAGMDPTKGLPAGVLPKYAIERDGQFAWAVKLAGVRHVSKKRFPTAALAHRAGLRFVTAKAAQ